MSTNPDYLANIGLTPDQASIYLALLNNGPQSASGLAKLSGIKRTYIYYLCQELIKENLVSLTQQGKTTIFMPLSPDNLITRAEDIKTKAQTTLSSLESILPELNSKYRLTSSKPVVSYFEGLDGVKKVYRDTLTATTPILALVETNAVDPEVYAWVTKEYVKDRVKSQISVQAIVTTGDMSKDYVSKDELELRETKQISSKEYPFEQELNIYDDKVAFINHRAGEKLLGIIIHDHTIATTLRSWFNLTWNKI